MFTLVRGQDEPRVTLDTSEFNRQVLDGNVDSILVVEGKSVRGSLRSAYMRDGEEYRYFRATVPSDVSEERVAEWEAIGINVDAEWPDSPWWSNLIFVLPWVILIVFWFWVLRSMQGGGNKAFQFGRSKAKLISPDTPKVTFEDVAGADEAKEELSEVIEFLKDPKRFGRLGGRLPKGVLLIGPPGTGKTLLAKAVAGEAGRPFFQMSGSDFVEMFVGVGASRVRDLFEQGKAHAPCIIFIDEIDAVGRHRGAGLGGGHDEREQTLNQLLVEMDGFEANEGVILLAATNRPDVLDPALLRPGRFDRQVVVDAPDVKGREQILRVHARKLPLTDDVALDVIAKGTPGLSGADLANICNEAALLAAKGGAEKVSMSDFEQAKDKVMLGTERRSMVLTENERKLTAYHEAGHAVIGLRVPGLDPIHKVSIVPRGRALGITASLPQEDRHSYTKDWLQAQLCMLFGGRVAEEMIFGEDKVTTGAGNDIERATSMARRMVTRFGMSEVVGLMAVGDSDQEVFLGRDVMQRREVSEHTAQLVDQEVKRILDEAHARAREVLEAEMDLLTRIAEALLQVETLDRDDVAALAVGDPLPPREALPAFNDAGDSSGKGSPGDAEPGADAAGASDDDGASASGGDEGTSDADGGTDEEAEAVAPLRRTPGSAEPAPGRGPSLAEDPEPDAMRG
ncbi:MAG: ATP-dependent metallopeptidase FtsH/Yme1/Tma family protein [Gemmatimonadales bacterium]|nr:MAG: ATP-dependent metallopeptidase FtsH/Yme1/Tma family protein [Gemmatimonadales bacterium]